MMAALEELIATNRKAAEANIESGVLAVNQGLESNLGDIATEEGEIDPYYNKLIKESSANFQTALGNARTSASNAGVYRSGIRYNQELKLGAENASQTSEYGAERTRKLADISRRRSLLKKQATENANSIRAKGGADLEASIADLRYKEHLRQEEAKQRMKEIYASKSGATLSPSQQKQAMLNDNQETLGIIQGLANSGMKWGDAAKYVDNKYGKGVATKYDLAFKAVYGAKKYGRSDFFMSGAEREMYNSLYTPKPTVTKED
jgi:hypothetical protein